MRGDRLAIALWVLGACDPAAPPASCKTSCQLGTTLCHDSRLIGTCTQLVDGCYAYVSVPCPDGQYCDSDMNQCLAGDACSDTATLSACTRAALNLAQCCTYDPDPADLCETELALGLDALAACTHLHSVTCDVLHGELLPGCCCPPNFVCDLFSADCLQKCERGTDCPRGQNCGQLYAGAVNFPYVCSANIGCDEDHACSNGNCCVGDVNGNRFCAIPCDDSSMCPGSRCERYPFMDSTCSAPSVCGP